MGFDYSIHIQCTSYWPDDGRKERVMAVLST